MFQLITKQIQDADIGIYYRKMSLSEAEIFT